MSDLLQKISLRYRSDGFYSSMPSASLLYIVSQGNSQEKMGKFILNRFWKLLNIQHLYFTYLNLLTFINIFLHVSTYDTRVRKYVDLYVWCMCHLELDTHFRIYLKQMVLHYISYLLLGIKWTCSKPYSFLKKILASNFSSPFIGWFWHSFNRWTTECLGDIQNSIPVLIINDEL